MVKYLVENEKIPYNNKNMFYAISHGKFKTKEYL